MRFATTIPQVQSVAVSSIANAGPAYSLLRLLKSLLGKIKETSGLKTSPWLFEEQVFEDG